MTAHTRVLMWNPCVLGMPNRLTVAHMSELGFSFELGEYTNSFWGECNECLFGGCQ